MYPTAKSEYDMLLPHKQHIRFESIRTFVLFTNSDSEGRWFESSRAYVKIPRNLARFRGVFVFGDMRENV